MAGAGSIIGGRFTLGRRLGAGGMGEVWSAVDRDGGACAVKLIRPDVYDDALVPRFRREAQITAALRSDNVVRVIAWGEGDGELFVAMELLAGVSLKSRLQLGYPLPWRQACAVARDVANGLAHAHAAAIVHRDVKPANIMLVDNGARAVLLDFGVARSVEAGSTMTGSGFLVGTAGYIAPEVAHGGQPFDVRADIYSLGVTLYETLVGAPPFVAANALALAARHANEDPRPPSEREPGVPANVDALVMQMIARAPAGRPASAAATAAALAALLDGGTTTPSAPPSSSVVAVWRSEYWVVSHDPAVDLVRMERTEQALQSAEDVGQVFSLVRSTFPPAARTVSSEAARPVGAPATLATEAGRASLARAPSRAATALIIDLRRGPMRTDPRYEKIVVAELAELYSGWRRVAVLVATERGLEQGRALRERAGAQARAFLDEDAAVSWLLSPAPTPDAGAPGPEPREP